MAAKTEAPQRKAGFLVLEECLSSLPTETATEGGNNKRGAAAKSTLARRVSALRGFMYSLRGSERGDVLQCASVQDGSFLKARGSAWCGPRERVRGFPERQQEVMQLRLVGPRQLSSTQLPD